MSEKGTVAKILRFIAIILMGLTAGFTLLGGIGTSCVALNPRGFSESMARLAPFQWLYILFVLVGIALGVLGIRATVQLIKAKEHSYLEALIVLIAGVLVGAIHMIISRALRGGSMPVDGVVYTTILTLLVFLILRLPPIWAGVNFAQGSAKSNRSAGGTAAILLGFFVLTIQSWMAPTHTWDGVNYADAFNMTMTIIGAGCLMVGAGMVIKSLGLNVRMDREILNNKANLE